MTQDAISSLNDACLSIQGYCDRRFRQFAQIISTVILVASKGKIKSRRMPPQGRIVREGSLYLLHFINLEATLVDKIILSRRDQKKSKKYTGQLETTGSTCRHLKLFFWNPFFRPLHVYHQRYYMSSMRQNPAVGIRSSSLLSREVQGEGCHQIFSFI